MEAAVIVALVLGVGSTLVNLALGLRSSGDDRTQMVLEAQAGWIATLDRRCKASERHAAACDVRLATIERFLQDQGLTPP